MEYGSVLPPLNRSVLVDVRFHLFSIDSNILFTSSRLSNAAKISNILSTVNPDETARPSGGHLKKSVNFCEKVRCVSSNNRVNKVDNIGDTIEAIDESSML